MNATTASPAPTPQRFHLVTSAGQWFRAARNHQMRGEMDEALSAMENAYNHVENELAAFQEPIINGESAKEAIAETAALQTARNAIKRALEHLGCDPCQLTDAMYLVDAALEIAARNPKAAIIENLHKILGRQRIQINELKETGRKQTGEQKHLLDLYFEAFEIAGGKPDDEFRSLPQLTRTAIQELNSAIAFSCTALESIDESYRQTLSELDWASFDYLTDKWSHIPPLNVGECGAEPSSNYRLIQLEYLHRLAQALPDSLPVRDFAEEIDRFIKAPLPIKKPANDAEVIELHRAWHNYNTESNYEIPNLQ